MLYLALLLFLAAKPGDVIYVTATCSWESAGWEWGSQTVTYAVVINPLFRGRTFYFCSSERSYNYVWEPSYAPPHQWRDPCIGGVNRRVILDGEVVEGVQASDGRICVGGEMVDVRAKETRQ